MRNRLVTIMALASYRLGRPARTGRDFVRARLSMLGGCYGCEASIAAYNAYPTRIGYWACADCIDRSYGWTSVVRADKDIFKLDRALAKIRRSEDR